MERVLLDSSRISTLEEALATLEKALAVISAQERQIAELQAKVAELSKDSSTSSKPPSSDIVKPQREQRGKGKGKRGGQQGRQGVNRIAFPPEDVDKVEKLSIGSCPDCDVGLVPCEDTPALVQQVVELREKPIHVTEFYRAAGRCPSCGDTSYASLPEGVIEGQLFGPRLQSLIGYMKGNLGASYSELAQFCEDVLSVKVSTGHLANVIKRVSEALKAPYEELQSILPQQAALNVDETGWHDLGKKFWVWLFCNSTLAYFTIQASRGSKVLRKVLGETFDGALISDFYSAYVCYANALQQFCLAHLIRDIKFLTTLPDQQTKEFGEQVLKYFKKLFELWHERDRWPAEVFQQKVKRLQRKLFTYLHSDAVPVGKATTLKKRLVKHWEALFRFIEQPELYQPTNNLAEQTLRHLIRIRRHSQGTRSKWGREWIARVMTVLETCKRQDRNAWQFMQHAINAHYFGIPAPSLVPTA